MNTPALRSYTTRQKWIPWLIVAPGIIFTLWLKYYPIFNGLYMSFFHFNALHPPGDFVGLQNYLNLLQEKSYWKAWNNTLVFLVLTLFIAFLVPLIQAIFLNEVVKWRKLFTTIYIIPSVISLSITVIIWRWFWNPDYGLANIIAGSLGMGKLLWLSDPVFTKFCIIVPSIVGGGVAVLLYLAAIQGIPEEIYEAAKMDGCSGWRKIFHITLPNIKFIILIQLMLAFISVMQILDGPFQFTNGGPNGAATSMGVFIYKVANEDVNYGKSSAAAMMLFAVILLLSLLQLKLDRTERE